MTKKILATQRSRMYRLFKESLKCCSCGYDRDSSALEFHHTLLDYLRTIDGQSASIINKKKIAKEFNVSDMSIRRDLMELQNNGSININGIVEVLI